MLKKVHIQTHSYNGSNKMEYYDLEEQIKTVFKAYIFMALFLGSVLSAQEVQGRFMLNLTILKVLKVLKTTMFRCCFF